MPGIIESALAKGALSGAAKTAITKLNSLFVRNKAIRNAQAGMDTPEYLESEIDKVLYILSANPDGFFDTLRLKFEKAGKGILPIYNVSAIKEFLRDTSARALFKEIVTKKNVHGQFDQEFKQLASLYAKYTGEHESKAHGILDITIETLFADVQAVMSDGERLLGTIINIQQEETRDIVSDELSKLHKKHETTHQKLDLLTTLFNNSSQALLCPANEACDDFILKNLIRLEKQLGFTNFDITEAILSLFQRTQNGDLQQASDGVKNKLLCSLIVALTRQGKIDKAKDFLSTLRGMPFQQEYRLQEASILYAEKQYAEVVTLLASATGTEEVGLFFQAKVALDGLETGILSYRGREKHIVISGNSLFELTVAAIRNKKLEIAKELVEHALPEQLSQCPMLFAVRYSVYLMLSAPFLDTSLIPISAPLCPKSTIFNELSECCKLREKALEDAEEFLRAIQSIDEKSDFSSIEETILWLKLSHPEPSIKEKAILELSSLAKKPLLEWLPWLRFFLDYQIITETQCSEVERFIEEQRGDNAELPSKYILPYLVCILQKKDPKRILSTILRYREEIGKIITESGVKEFEIEALARDGDISSANKKIDEYYADDDSSKKYMSAVVAQVSGGDVSETSQQAFEARPTIGSRLMLIDALLSCHRYSEAIKHLLYVFNSVQTTSLAKQIAESFILGNDFEGLSRFLDRKYVIDLEQQDASIKSYRGYLAFHEGDILSAKLISKALMVSAPDQNNQTLYVNSAIASFSIDELFAYLSSLLPELEAKSVTELRSLMHVAISIDFRDTKKILNALAQKAQNDKNPYILVDVYTMAVKLGIEDRESFMWMQQALELSGSSGPVYRYGIEELPEMAAEWKASADHINNLIRIGEGILSFAAERFNTSLSSIVLGGLISNSAQCDFRKKNPIPLYAANRNTLEEPHNINRIALDRTSLMTLYFLNVLPQVFDSFSDVMIGQNTVPEFLSDLQKLRFHQPLSVKKAQHFLQQVEKQRIDIIGDEVVADKSLNKQVGSELGRLIEAALPDNIVLVSPPIYNLGNPTKGLELANIEEYKHAFCDISTLASWMQHFGYISNSIYNKILETIPQEASWGWCPILRHGQSLYVDDLAIDLLAAFELLPLVSSIFKIHADKKTFRQSTALLSHVADLKNTESNLMALLDLIHQGILNGKVKLTPTYVVPTNGEMGDSSLAQILFSPSNVDAVCIDDRAINKLDVTNDTTGNSARIVCSLDILHHLHDEKKIISDDVLFEKIQSLREAGVIFIPLSSDEFTYYLNREAKAELTSNDKRVISNYIDYLVLIDFIKIPDEAQYIINSTSLIRDTIQNVWNILEDDEKAENFSNWLKSVLDSFENFFDFSVLSSSSLLSYKFVQLVSIFDVSAINEQRVQSYHNWLEKCIFIPMLLAHQNAEQEFVEDLIRFFFAEVTELPDLNDIDEEQKRRIGFQIYFYSLPQFIQNAILSHPNIIDMLADVSTLQTTIDVCGYAIFSDSLFQALACLANGEPVPNLKGPIILPSVMMCYDGGEVLIKIDKIINRFPAICLFSNNLEERKSLWASLSAKNTITKDDYEKWNKIILSGPLSADNFYALKDILDQSPEVQSQKIKDLPLPNAFAQILPFQEHTFKILLGDPVYYTTPHSFGVSPIGRDVPSLDSNELYSWLMAIGPCCIAYNSGVVACALLKDPEKLTQAIKQVCDDANDLFTLLLCFDICAQGVASNGIFADVGSDILKKILGTPALIKSFELAAPMVLGAMAQKRYLQSESLYYRRLAGWTWAGYVSRELFKLGINIGKVEISSVGYPRVLAKFANLVEQSESSYWDFVGLTYGGLLGQAYSRLELALHGVVDIPSEWKNLLSFAKNKLEEDGVDVFRLLPGPLDEFIDKDHVLYELNEDECKIIFDNFENFSSREFLTRSAFFVSAAKIPVALIEKFTSAGRDVLYHVGSGEGEATISAARCLSRLSAILKNEELANLSIDILNRNTQLNGAEFAIAELYCLLDASGAFIDDKKRILFLKKRLEKLAFGPINNNIAVNCIMALQVGYQVKPELREPTKKAYTAFSIAKTNKFIL